MKKNTKKTEKPSEPKKPAETAHEQNASAVSPTPKSTFMERVRQRVQVSRQAAINKAVTQSPD